MISSCRTKNPNSEAVFFFVFAFFLLVVLVVNGCGDVLVLVKASTW